MLIVYEDLFPDAYLVVLAPSNGPASEAGVAGCLRRAARCARPEVWVDCRLLDTVSAPAGRLLLALYHRLQRRQARLVLCHVSAALAQCLRALEAVPSAGFVVATSLGDTAFGCLPAT